MDQRPPASLPKAYEPRHVEGRLYRFWLERGYFTPQIQPEKEPFVIIMPPPNVTGELHMGHALTTTLEDLMVRWHRMRGEPTLWLPGTDHAGIATQVVVERELAREGLSRHDLGREKFLERVWDWVRRYGGRIEEQLQRLGASCDWTRKRFTMDPGPSRAVRTTFVRLYRKGLIYRGERIIHWCPRCATALSDLEVEYREREGALYYIRYPSEDGGKGVVVATTRPETMLGDTGVAVHPEDERYRGLVGRRVVLPLVGRLIPIVADAAVDPEFGTGALKITPAHDPADFEIGQRHRLPLVQVIGPDGRMTQEAGPFAGLDRFEAREAVVRRLQEEGLLERVQPVRHSVGHCQRCGTVVEPLISLQWFVRMEPLARPAIEAVERGDIRIIPEHFTRVYLNWMRNIRDWCISRQIWWGHRIPVWYCDACGHPNVAEEDPTACERCGSTALTQDPDVLDTWFSSALWPHSTLGWPDDTEDLRYFYPTTVMETGYDILFFWVARMIMMGLANTGKIPFRYVYLHGLVRDEKGEKMAKTRGNVIDPVWAIDTYGCDALRFALTVGLAPGTDQRMSHPKLEGARNFANKVWNASRFVLLALEGASGLEGWFRLPRLEHLEDRWIVSRLNRLIGRVNRLMEEFHFGEAAQAIYDFLWGEFCDWYIELAKVRLREGSAPVPLPVLAHTLERVMRLLHPYMPFLTEEVWQNLRARLPEEGNLPDSIMVAPYPQEEAERLDPQAEEAMEAVMEVVRFLRATRAEFRLPPQQALPARVDPGPYRQAMEGEAGAIRALARAEPLEFLEPGAPPPDAQATVSTVVGRGATVFVPVGGLVDLEKERARLRKELEQVSGQVEHLSARLGNPEFLQKAPEEVVARERERLQALQERAERVQALLRMLGA